MKSNFLLKVGGWSKGLLNGLSPCSTRLKPHYWKSTFLVHIKRLLERTTLKRFKALMRDRRQYAK